MWGLVAPALMRQTKGEIVSEFNFTEVVDNIRRQMEEVNEFLEITGKYVSALKSNIKAKENIIVALKSQIEVYKDFAQGASAIVSAEEEQE